MFLILDTETTGVTPQDRIVSICWALYDLTANEITVKHHIIYPDGFAIPSGASAVHGITTEHARRLGIPLQTALQGLRSDVASFSPQLYIGHNVSFDRPIILNEYRRINYPENISSLGTFCTMKTGTNVCRIASNRGGYKWPKLEELHRHLFGRAHASARDAKGDVSATAKCFFELRRLGHA
jgi:DNA polymerase III epsilon subunit-like protein